MARETSDRELFRGILAKLKPLLDQHTAAVNDMTRNPSGMYFLRKWWDLRWRSPSRLGCVVQYSWNMLDSTDRKTGQILACVGSSFEISAKTQMPLAPP